MTQSFILVLCNYSLLINIQALNKTFKDVYAVKGFVPPLRQQQIYPSELITAVNEKHIFGLKLLMLCMISRSSHLEKKQQNFHLIFKDCMLGDKYDFFYQI